MIFVFVRWRAGAGNSQSGSLSCDNKFAMSVSERKPRKFMKLYLCVAKN